LSISNWPISKDLTTLPQGKLLCQAYVKQRLRHVPSNLHHQIPFQNNTMILIKLDGQGMWPLN
jgi:hypothetical protein